MGAGHAVTTTLTCFFFFMNSLGNHRKMHGFLCILLPFLTKGGISKFEIWNFSFIFLQIDHLYELFMSQFRKWEWNRKGTLNHLIYMFEFLVTRASGSISVDFFLPIMVLKLKLNCSKTDTGENPCWLAAPGLTLFKKNMVNAKQI